MCRYKADLGSLQNKCRTVLGVPPFLSLRAGLRDETNLALILLKVYANMIHGGSPSCAAMTAFIIGGGLRLSRYGGQPLPLIYPSPSIPVEGVDRAFRLRKLPGRNSTQLDYDTGESDESAAGRTDSYFRSNA
jgi:hypothetical protein